MTLYRLKLRPLSPWRTPWQADTLTGMLLAMCARVHGADVLRDLFIQPMLEGKPLFVLSDAFPGDLLPVPLWLRLARWPAEVDRKTLKRARWLDPASFRRAQFGQTPAHTALIADTDVFLEQTRHHNTLDRLTNTTGESTAGLGIYNRPETQLRIEHEDSIPYLSIYFRILEPGADELLLELFDELALTGYGADSATGRGQFEIVEEPESVPELDQAPGSTNAVIALSTFQPGANDPAHGVWEAFPKFGKLGPGFGLPETGIRKNTLILIRPGACFLAPEGIAPCLGRAVPMHELLHAGAIDYFTQQESTMIHPAFALTVPAALDSGLLQ